MTTANGRPHELPTDAEALLGEWEIVYPGEAENVETTTRERLVLRRDGTYSWHPTPSWARPTGRWGVRIEPELNEAMVLGFEARAGAPRCHFVIPVKLPQWPLYWVWQRSLGVVVHPGGRQELDRNTVLFSERVLLAQRPRI